MAIKPGNGNCPQCGGEQHCPCQNCAARNAGKVTWKWDETGEIIACGHCGFAAHADQWMYWEDVRPAYSANRDQGPT